MGNVGKAVVRLSPERPPRFFLRSSTSAELLPLSRSSGMACGAPGCVEGSMTIERVRWAALLRQDVRLLTATGGVQRTHIRAGQHQGIQVLIAKDLMHHRLGIIDMVQSQSVSEFMSQDEDEIV